MLAVMTLPLADVLAHLEAIAPLELAEEWDNVGLLVESGPSHASGAQPRLVDRALLTIELNQIVLDEARRDGCQLVVSYHPPVFHGFKRLVRKDPTARVVLDAIAARIDVYSPHTALDAAPGGVNDWLCEALGQGNSEPLQPALETGRAGELKLVVFVPADHVDALREALGDEAGAGVIGEYSGCSFMLQGQGTFWGGEGTSPAIGEAGRLERVNEVRLEMVCPAGALPRAAQVIQRVHPYEEPAWDAIPLVAKPRLGAGQGRAVELRAPAPLDGIVERVKQHLGLRHVRLAAAARHRDGDPIRRGAVCAGAGATVLKSARNVDLLLTGEMRHHDVRSWVDRGVSVVLCDHTNTERGYLPRLAQTLTERCGGALTVSVSRRDRDPLEVV